MTPHIIITILLLAFQLPLTKSDPINPNFGPNITLQYGQLWIGPATLAPMLQSDNTAITGFLCDQDPESCSNIDKSENITDYFIYKNILGYTADVNLTTLGANSTPIHNGITFEVPDAIVGLTVTDFNPNGCYNPSQCVNELGYLGFGANSQFIENLPSSLKTGVFSILTDTNKYWQIDDTDVSSSDNENIDGWILFGDHSKDIYFNGVSSFESNARWEVPYTQAIVANSVLNFTGNVRFDPSVLNILMPQSLYDAYVEGINQGNSYCEPISGEALRLGCTVLDPLTITVVTHGDNITFVPFIQQSQGNSFYYFISPIVHQGGNSSNFNVSKGHENDIVLGKTFFDDVYATFNYGEASNPKVKLYYKEKMSFFNSPAFWWLTGLACVLFLAVCLWFCTFYRRRKRQDRLLKESYAEMYRTQTQREETAKL